MNDQNGHGALSDALASQETTDDGMLVVFGMVEKSETEKRLDAIEAGQDIQDGAISDLAEVVSVVVEGA